MIHIITAHFLIELCGANQCERCGDEEVALLDRAVLGALEINPEWCPTDEEFQTMTDGEEDEMLALIRSQPNGEAIEKALTACFGSME